jgi:hypothetical protein
MAAAPIGRKRSGACSRVNGADRDCGGLLGIVATLAGEGWDGDMSPRANWTSAGVA